MNENKFKVIIKGNDFKFSTKTSGNIRLIAAALAQVLIDISIEQEISKTEFLKIMKNCYEAKNK